MKYALRSLVAILMIQGLAFANRTADLVIVNAAVRTMSAENARAEAIAISGNEIIAVGSNKTIRALASEATTVIDARGRLVLPGFNDAHVHFIAIGNLFSSLDLRDVTNSLQFAERVAQFSAFLPSGRWILGGQLDAVAWAPGSAPDLKLIDAVSPNNPLFIYFRDPRIAFANSAALKQAGVSKTPESVPGGTIDREPDGSPTGVLRGKAIELVSRLVPADHTRRYLEVAETASKYAASLGVTSVQDTHSDDHTGVYRELEKRGKLKTRIYDCSQLSDWTKKQFEYPKPASGLVRNGCLKTFIEGDGKHTPSLESDIFAADKAGFQIAVHAIGAEPINEILGIFDRTTEVNGRRERRFRIEHAERAGGEAFGRFAKGKIVVSMQPHLFGAVNSGDGEYYCRMLEKAGMVAFGSDAPMTDLNPLLGIAAAVGDGKSNGRSFTVEEAVRAYTIGSAYAEYQEKVKGAIEVGKLADLIILSENIFEIDPARIGMTRVLVTIVDGKIVYKEN